MEPEKKDLSKLQNILESNGYTIGDAVSVYLTGDLPTKTPAGDYDRYMVQATDIYNKSVAEADKMAQNQSAMAGAQYREVQRNLNELNKASGKANTGYAEDTSINAYNSYRNAVNESYANADKSKNELYSYYMNEMLKLGTQKTAQEDAELNFDLSTIKEYALNNLVYNEDGTVTSDSAKKYYDYVSNYYGGKDKIPTAVLNSMLTEKGMSTWYNNHENGTPQNYVDDIKPDKLVKIDAYDDNYNINKNGNGNMDFAVLSTTKPDSSSSIRNNTALDNFQIEYNGVRYYVETSNKKFNASSNLAQFMDSQIKASLNREPTEGDCCYYNGRLYVRSKDGKYREIQQRERKVFKNSYNDFLSAVKYNIGK